MQTLHFWKNNSEKKIFFLKIIPLFDECTQTEYLLLFYLSLSNLQLFNSM